MCSSNLLKQHKQNIENNIQHHQQINIHLNNLQSQLIHKRFIMKQYEAAQQYYQFISDYYAGSRQAEAAIIPPLPQISDNFINNNMNNDFSNNYDNGNVNHNKNINNTNNNTNNNNNNIHEKEMIQMIHN